MPYPGLLHPEPLPPRQATADPYLLRRHSNTVLAQSLWGLWGPLRLVLSLSGSLGCLSPLGTSGRWGLWFSIWFCPCYHLAGAIPLPLDVGYFFFFFLVESNILHSTVVQQRVVLEFSQKMSAIPPTLPSYATKKLNANKEPFLLTPPRDTLGLVLKSRSLLYILLKLALVHLGTN